MSNIEVVNSGIQVSSAPASGTAEKASPAAVAGEAGGIGSALSATVRFNGKEMTVAEMAARAAEAEGLRAQVEKMTPLVTAAKTMMNPNADPETAQGALMTMLRDSGYSEAQAKAYVSQVFSTGEPAPAAKTAGNKEGAVDGNVLAEMERRLQTVTAETQEQRRAALGYALEESLRQGLESPDLKPVLDASRRLSGDAFEQKALPAVKQRIKEAALVAMRDYVDANGVKVTPDLVERFVAQAAKAEGENMRALFGNVDGLGRAPKSELDVLTEIATKKDEVQPPKPGALADGQEYAQREEALEKWSMGRFEKLAAGAALAQTRLEEQQRGFNPSLA